ncbi:MAG: hypothetical protein ACRDPS_12045 [Nocardioides sp.]|uniref:hypothetical protein n=1 Tax=Nocardioides sp. TaxID=35761 RepID=UPI003D6A4748
MSGLQAWRTSLVVALLVGALAGCGSDEEPAGGGGASAVGASEVGGADPADGELLVDQGVTCTQDVSSEEAKSTIERVGGLQQPTWSVRFAESTAAGVVVLVAGDLEEAEPELFDVYEVAAIVGSSDDQTRADDFRAVHEAVRRICG